MENLDMACAKLGQSLATANDVNEKLLTDVLGVLEEQGLYAALLFAKARGRALCNEVNAFLTSTPKASPLASSNSKNGRSGKNDVLAAIKDIAADLDKLLLARDLVRQALVYARYHIKAR